MDKNNLIELEGGGFVADPLSELIREGVRKLLARAVEAEVQELLSKYEGQDSDRGLKAVVRSGHQPPRTIQASVAPVRVKIPKLRSNTGKAVMFRSALVPPYVRKIHSLEALVPWLYLKGVCSGEMSETLRVLLGQDASGYSSSVVSALKRKWQDEFQQWKQRAFDQERWVYIWVDGIFSGLRSEDVQPCSRVIIGVIEHGQKKFLAIEDAVRESTQSWRELLLNLKQRGMNAPKEAVGDGAMVFWSALDEVYPQTRQQCCWVHKTANVLNQMPKLAQAKAKTALQQIWMAETRAQAYQSLDQFVEVYEAKYPKACQCLLQDRDELLVFYDFPAHHWQSLRSTNPIESAFATIRHRTCTI